MSDANFRETCSFLHEVWLSCSSTVVRSCPVLGQAHTPRRRVFPFAAIALAVLIAPSVGGANPSQTTRSLRAQDAAIVAKSRAAVLGLYSLDARLAVAQVEAGVASNASAFASAGAAELAPSARGGEAKHPHLAGARCRAAARALRARRGRAARDRARLDEPRRGDDESRRPESLRRPGPGHPARARRRPEGDRPRLTRARCPHGRSHTRQRAPPRRRLRLSRRRERSEARTSHPCPRSVA